MGGDIDSQAAALKLLWPEISAYCTDRGITRERLLAGSSGVPVDGSRLMARCQRMMLTKYELADEAGISYDMLIKILGEKRNPSVAAFSQLVRVLECDPADLFRKQVTSDV